MARYAELADGTTLEFPDETPDEIIAATVKKQISGGAEQPKATVQEEQITQGDSMAGIKRGLGLGTRSVIEGLAALPDIPIRALNAVNALAGGDPNYFKTIGGTATSALGLPKPETQEERLLSAVQSGAAAAIPTLGAGFSAAPAVGAARVSPTLGSATAEALRTAPLIQAASGAAGGGSAQLAAESGAGPYGQLAAGLAGGIVPSLAAMAGAALRSGARTAAAPFTEGGRNVRAAESIERMAQNPQEARAALAGGAPELIEGSQPTLAQVTQDPGLASLEQGMISRQGGSAINQRYLAQKEAQLQATNELLEPVQGRIEQQLAGIEPELRAASPYGGRLGEEQVGRGIRGEFDPAYQQMRARVREAYEAIDPQGTAQFDLSPLAEKFNSVVSSGGRYQSVPQPVRQIFNQVMSDVEQGVPATYRDLQGARAQLSELAQSAATSGDATTARIAGLFKNELDSFIDDSAARGVGFTPEQSAQLGQARALRTEQGQRFESGANEPLTRRGGSLSGQAIAESRIPGSYLQPGGIGGENIRALTGAAPGAAPMMKDYIIGQAAGVKNAGQMRDFLKNYGPALSELGDADLQNTLNTAMKNLTEVEAKQSGIAQLARRDQGGEWVLKRGRVHPSAEGNVALTPQEQQRITAIQQDIQRAIEASRLAQVGGSQTARNLNVQDMLGQFGLRGGGPIRGLINEGISKFTTQGNQAVEQAILDAILNPEKARTLLNMQRPEALQDILRRLGTAGAISTGREAARQEQ